MASSDSHCPFVAARVGGGLATSDQDEASSETDMVGFLRKKVIVIHPYKFFFKNGTIYLF